jgi:AraC-like DNA-binding protein
MTKIEVQSLPLFEVVRDIAIAFGVDYEENCGEYHVSIPSTLGEGYIKGINFDGGFGILLYNCTFKDDLEFHFVVDDIHPLKFLYCLKGILHHRFLNITKNNTIEQYQSSIIASKSNNGHILHFPAGTEVHIGSLEIDREKFKEKVNCELKGLSPKLKQLFMDSKAENEFYHSGNYSLKIASLFEKIQSFENNDFIRIIFMEGQAYSILTHQIEQFHADLNEENGNSVLRSSEISQIKKASNIIDDDLANLASVEKIAEEVGLNINKLQLGFKHLFETTVNGYVQQKRMSLARNLLNNTDYNISEIVTKIGLSSKSYFSKIFKETYGI